MRLRSLCGCVCFVLFLCAEMSAQTNPYIDSTRPTISSDAAIQQRGVLQVESGYDGYFAPYGQTVATSLFYAVTNQLRISASLDAFRSATNRNHARTTGIGTSSYGAKVVLFHDGRSKTFPGLALEYKEMLATATEPGLQSRSHQGTLIMSNTAGRWRWKVNGSAFGAGCHTANGCSVHGQGAVGVSYSLGRPTTLFSEFFGQTTSAGAPPGAYVSGGLTHNIDQRFDVNGGLRFGVTAAAPIIGVTFGLTIGIGKTPVLREKP